MNLPLLRFVEDGALLSFRGPVPPGEWELIPDLPAAKARAWDQSSEFPCWTDLRESVVAASGAWRLWTAGLSEAVAELVFAYTPWPFAELENDIGADLANCAAYQAGGGSRERLYPALLGAYAAGGWPCGWSGAYPAGRLCVFWPAGPVTLPEPASAHERRLELLKRRARDRICTAAEPGTAPDRGGS